MSAADRKFGLERPARSTPPLELINTDTDTDTDTPSEANNTTRAENSCLLFVRGTSKDSILARIFVTSPWQPGPRIKNKRKQKTQIFP